MSWCKFPIICILSSLVSYSSAQKIFLVAGQSNAVGVGDSFGSPSCLENMAFEYSFTKNIVVPLKDPTGVEEFGFERAKTGSCWPAFAKQYNNLTDGPVTIVQAARGGSSCNPSYLPHLRWDVDGDLLGSAILKVEGALKLTNLPLSGVIWIQGEADAVFINDGQFTGAMYKRSLLQSIDRLRSKFSETLPFYIVQTGLASGLSSYGFEEIQRVQDEVARENKNCYIIYSFTKLFFEYDLMSDYIHYNQNGYNILGRSCADAIYEIEKTGKLNDQVLTNEAFPNPAKNEIIVRFTNLLLAENARIEIVDDQGRNVKSFPVELDVKLLESIKLDIGDVKSGSYILRIHCLEKISAIKIKIG